MDILEQMFSVITQVVHQFVAALGTAITEITKLLYTTESGFTMLGVLTLVAVGCGLVYFVWRLIAGLIRQRR